jgi:PTH1 family peptidyl-tRNA hydrolase
MHFLTRIFSQNSKEKIDPMKKILVVGLGNPGIKYAETRHNIGFKILDHLAAEKSLTFEPQRYGEVSKFNFKGKNFTLLKPSTFMNLSGKAVRYWLDKEKINTANLLVVTDDLNLAFGTIRLKQKGSDGGHNGLKDIQEKLGTTQYPRFRFGISDAYAKGNQIDYVLGEWDETERPKLKERLDKSAALIHYFGVAGISETMNQFNGK